MLNQAEADAYIAESKYFPLPTAVPVAPGVNASYQLVGSASGTAFQLDVWRGSIRLTRVKLQNRVKTSTVLVRIDDARHTNPDGTQMEGFHIHRYREGFDDKWAEPLNEDDFGDTSDVENLFRAFCAYCNIDHSHATVQAGLL